MRLWWLILLSLSVQADPPPLVLISMDGFRWDYADKVATPHIDRIFAQGFRVNRMEPSFPSLTFPNHYTLVTGMHPHHHGIVGNQFFDTARGDGYSMYENGDVTDPSWYLSPAIWEVAEREGLQAASYFWVGSEMRGRHPSIYFAYDRKVTPETKIATLLKWLDPAQQPTPKLMLVYFPFVDSAGHLFGPDSPEVIFAVQRMDALLGSVLDGFARLQVQPNLVVVSDHGMTKLNGTALKVETVVQAIGSDLILDKVNNYSQLDLYLRNPTPAVIRACMAKLPQLKGYTWYTRGEAPVALHPERNGHIVGIAEPGYVFQKGDRRSRYQGGHGYISTHRDMAAACFGLGPSFVGGTRLEKVQSVDVFSLLCHLLALPPQSSDGEVAVWQPVLKAP